MIKKIILSLLLVVYANALEYSNDFNSVLTTAKEQDKKVLLMYTQKGCPACQYMKDVVFENKQISTYLHMHYKVAIVDIYQDGMINGYKAFGTPTLFFLDSDGKELSKKLVGGISIPEFYIKLTSIK
jgi:thioredoxin-related protein